MDIYKLNTERKKYDSILIPEDLDIYIERGKNQAVKNRRKKFLKPAGIVAAAIILFTVMINTSQQAAEAVNEVPILSSLSSILVINEEIKYALKHDYIQTINKKISIDGTTVTITRIIGDVSKLIVGYTVDNERINAMEKDSYTIDRIMVTNDDGSEIFGDTTWGIINYADDGLVPLEGEKYFSIENTREQEIPDDIIISLRNIINSHCKHGETNEVICKGDFDFNIELKKKITEVKPEEYIINKDIETGKGIIHINDVKIYPMSIEINGEAKLLRSYEIFNFPKSYIEDEKGRRYLWERTDTLGNDVKIVFHGGAFQGNDQMKFFFGSSCIRIK